MLAETIKNHIKGECCYYGKADLAPLMADYIFVGFWTDKGTCDESIQDYLKQLHHQKSFYLELLVLVVVKNILMVF